MPTPTVDYEWPQGEDLDIILSYAEGEEGEEVPVDLTGFQVRMDVVHPVTREVLYRFNSEDMDPATVDEAILNAGGTGNILISVPRWITLPGAAVEDDGPLYSAILDDQLTFEYDIFLRNANGKQKKLYGGNILIEPSRTLWR